MARGRGGRSSLWRSRTVMKTHLPILFLTLAALPSVHAQAHEMRPAYLEIRESAPEIYDVLWKVPARGTNERLSLHLRFADDVEVLGEPVSGFTAGAHIQRMRIRRVGGLTGTTVTIDGLTSTYTDVLLRLERLDGTAITHRLSPSSPSYVVEAEPGKIQVAATYTRLGIEHILLGIDHLLFVACLMFVAGGGRRLLITITGFTLAHSVTLVLSALELVRLPVPPVEAAIALSIVFLAVEIARGKRDSLTFRYPIAVSASFGLLHGFGFAAVLRDIGLPQHDIPTALVCFNVGVEIGQVSFVGALLLLVYASKGVLRWCVARSVDLLASRVRTVAAYLIGSVASCWLIERVAAFVGQ